MFKMMNASEQIVRMWLGELNTEENVSIKRIEQHINNVLYK